MNRIYILLVASICWPQFTVCRTTTNLKLSTLQLTAADRQFHNICAVLRHCLAGDLLDRKVIQLFAVY